MIEINGNTSCLHGSDDLILLKYQYYAIYRFYPIPVKNLMIFFLKRKTILKLIWKLKGPQIAKTILKKNETRKLRLTDFEITTELQ